MLVIFVLNGFLAEFFSKIRFVAKDAQLSSPIAAATYVRISRMTSPKAWYTSALEKQLPAH